MWWLLIAVKNTWDRRSKQLNINFHHLYRYVLVVFNFRFETFRDLEKFSILQMEKDPERKIFLLVIRIEGNIDFLLTANVLMDSVKIKVSLKKKYVFFTFFFTSFNEVKEFKSLKNHQPFTGIFLHSAWNGISNYDIWIIRLVVDTKMW